MPAFSLSITTGSNTPIYRQIVEQVRLAVATGRLAVAHPMPSVRALAEQLLVNPNTVARAYGELVREGVLTAHQGKGVFVAERRAMFTAAERKRRMHEALEGFINEAIFLDFSAEQIRAAVDDRLKALHWHTAVEGETS